MGWVIVLLLVLAAAAGALGLVVKVALGVALGLVLAVILAAWLVSWRIRRALYRGGTQWRRVRGSSRVEILERPERH